MARKKKYIDKDVYTAAKERIRHVIDTFDTIMVAFSGGKDSLTVVNLVEEVYRELGINEKVKVFFRDEELIPSDVIDFVLSMANSGRYDFRYYAIPLQSHKFILGKTYEYVQWDKNRDWLRQPPANAIRLADNDDRVFSQYDADAYICQNEKGRIAIMTGIRADESLTRLASCMNKRNENYINATEDNRIKLVKPIYDWTVKDVFTYFKKNDIKYCSIYDKEMWNNNGLRVSTPLHAEASKRLFKLKTEDPIFYDQLMELFPEMQVQSRYWTSLDRDAIYQRYDHTFDGIREYIKQNIEDVAERKKAMHVTNMCETIRKNTISKNPENLTGGYPILYVFKQIVAGNYKRMLSPKSFAMISRAEKKYEGIA